VDRAASAFHEFAWPICEAVASLLYTMTWAPKIMEGFVRGERQRAGTTELQIRHPERLADEPGARGNGLAGKVPDIMTTA